MKEQYTGPMPDAVFGETIHIDMCRMNDALSSELIDVPSGLSREEIRQLIIQTHMKNTHGRFVQTLNLSEHRGALAGPIKEKK